MSEDIRYGMDQAQAEANEMKSKIASGAAENYDVAEKQIGPEHREDAIGDVDISEWVRGGMKDSELLPRVSNSEELRRVLAFKAMQRDSVSVYRNWNKGAGEFNQTDEWEAFLDYLADNWLMQSNDLKSKAPKEWSEKFRDIVEMLSRREELSSTWLEASVHLKFMRNEFGIESTIGDLMKSAKSEDDIQWINAKKLEQAHGLVEVSFEDKANASMARLKAGFKQTR